MNDRDRDEDQAQDQTDQEQEDRPLSQLFAQVPTLEPSAQLRRMVAEIPLRHPHAQGQTQGYGLLWPLRSAWQGLLSAALVASLGMAVGFATVTPDVAQAATSEEAQEWEELRALAFATELEDVLDAAELSP